MWPHSIRYGREVGTTMLIFIMAMAYSATSPIILPFALVYFIATWCALACPLHRPPPSACTLHTHLVDIHSPSTHNLKLSLSAVWHLSC